MNIPPLQNHVNVADMPLEQLAKNPNVSDSEKVGEACRPAFREVQILRVRNLQLGFKRREPQRHNESVVTDFLRCLGGDADFVADALLLDAVRCGYQ